jgi:sodium/potassium-transporting ATPase subunit alpha
MGSGSEVAMEASQMVLLDNSFGSILTAIENGRLVFYNLRKVILYLLIAGCMGEVVPVLTNAFLGIPLPLSTFQMICICVLTDICPSLSLMLEKPEKNLLKQPPRSRNTRLVDWKLCFQAYFFIGFLQTFFSHCLFFWYLQWYGNFEPSDILFVYDKWEDGYHGYTKNQLNEFEYTAQTIVFTSIVIMQSFGNVFTSRTNVRSIITSPPFFKRSLNLWIFPAQFVSVLLLVLIIFLPFINSFFYTRQIPVQFYFIPLLFSAIILLLDEFRKFLVRRKVFCFPKIAW